MQQIRNLALILGTRPVAKILRWSAKFTIISSVSASVAHAQVIQEKEGHLDGPISDSGVSISNLVRTLDRTYEGLSTLELSYTLNVVRKAGKTYAGNASEQPARVDFAYDRNASRTAVRTRAYSDNDLKSLVSENVRIWDGTYGFNRTSLVSMKPGRGVTADGHAESPGTAVVSKSDYTPFINPLLFAVLFGKEPFCRLLLNQSFSPSVVSAEEVKLGRRAIHADLGKGGIHFWFDKEIGLPLLVNLGWYENAPAQIYEILQLQTIAGVLFPTKMRYTERRENVDLKVEINVDPSTVKINQPASEQLKVDYWLGHLPPGISVTDAVNGTVYAIPMPEDRGSSQAKFTTEQRLESMLEGAAKQVDEAKKEQKTDVKK